MSDGIQWQQHNVQSGIIVIVGICLLFAVLFLETVGSLNEHEYNEMCAQTTYEQSLPASQSPLERAPSHYTYDEGEQAYFDNQLRVAISERNGAWLRLLVALTIWELLDCSLFL